MTVQCSNCGSLFGAQKGLTNHRRHCTLDAPRARVVRNRQPQRATCGICHLVHSPLCVATTATWPTQALVDAVGVDVVRDRAAGRGGGLPERLTDRRADRWAVACGLHPELVWPGWCEAALTRRDAAMLGGGWRPAWLWAEAQRDAAETVAVAS